MGPVAGLPEPTMAGGASWLAAVAEELSAPVLTALLATAPTAMDRPTRAIAQRGILDADMAATFGRAYGGLHAEWCILAAVQNRGQD